MNDDLSAKVSFYCTVEQKEELKQRAKAASLDLSSWIRNKLVGGQL